MSEETPDLASLRILAREALPRNVDEWGSKRQIAAQNAFFDAIHPFLDEFENHLDAYCLKATVNEMVEEGMRIVAITLPRRDPASGWKRYLTSDDWTNGGPLHYRFAYDRQTGKLVHLNEVFPDGSLEGLSEEDLEDYQGHVSEEDREFIEDSIKEHLARSIPADFGWEAVDELPEWAKEAAPEAPPVFRR